VAKPHIITCMKCHKRWMIWIGNKNIVKCDCGFGLLFRFKSKPLLKG
jgi:DNA-directed RNA polymerase subunit RPC12/RpoP